MIKHTIARHSQIGKPERAVKLLKAAWTALELNELRSISQAALCRQLHVSQGTVINWLTGETELHQVEALLRILERLPEPTRHELLNRFLRCYPAMEADRLGHDPTSVSRLRKLLEERNGLTLITGGSDGSRTFLVTALGHAFQQLLSREGMIAGIDIHLPDWFVLVLGVSYLGFPCGSRRVREEALRLWPARIMGQCWCSTECGRCSRNGKSRYSAGARITMSSWPMTSRWIRRRFGRLSAK
jgi:transcriptional regulator with XRE-family HTH domain